MFGKKYSQKSRPNKNWVKRPLRKIIKAEIVEGRTLETLECGHQQYAVQDFIGETNAEKRRCRKCEAETP